MTELLFSLIVTVLLTSLFIIILSALLLLLKTKVSAKTVYRLWLLILVSLLIPLRPHFGQGIVEVQFQSWAASSASASSNVAAAAQDISIWDKFQQFYWLYLLLAVWLLGFLIVLGRQFLAYYRFRAMLKHWGQTVTDKRIQKRLEISKTALGISRPINVLLSPVIKSPMLTGFYRPVILLPAAHYTDEELDLIFEHELVHYKHHDLYTNLFIVTILALHWFNPLVHFACREMQEAAEAYCDETVLGYHGTGYRFYYSETILSMIDRSSKNFGMLTSCFYSNKFNLRRRILTIMENGKSLAFLSPFLILFLSFSLLGSGSVFALAGQNLSGTDSQIAKPSVSKNVNEEKEEPVSTGQPAEEPAPAPTSASDSANDQETALTDEAQTNQILSSAGTETQQPDGVSRSSDEDDDRDDDDFDDDRDDDDD